MLMNSDGMLLEMWLLIHFTLCYKSLKNNKLMFLLHYHLVVILPNIKY